MAQLVERILGKDEVISSTLISSSRSPVFEKKAGVLFCLNVNNHLKDLVVIDFTAFLWYNII